VISASDLRKGTKFLYKKEPYMVISFQHVKPGKGGAFVRTKMRNMLTGYTQEDTFRVDQKFEQPDLQYRQMQYLYVDDSGLCFMDQESFDQVFMDKKSVGFAINYLKEQEIYSVMYFDEKPVEINPPMFMELEVKETTPGVRGDTAQGGATKPATLETGYTLQIPLFVNEGDLVKIDTRDGVYVERVKK
jgi:elongation factor P